MLYAYIGVICLGVFAAVKRSSGVAWCAVGMMVCTLAVESVGLGTKLHYLCVGAVALIGGLIVRDWAFKVVFFLDALLNFSVQAFWIVAARDAGFYEYAAVVWNGYPFAVWAINGLLVLLFCGILQGPQTRPPSCSGNRSTGRDTEAA